MTRGGYEIWKLLYCKVRIVSDKAIVEKCNWVCSNFDVFNLL